MDVRPLVGVIVPVYRNADTLRELCARLAAVFAPLPYRLEIVLVIDASPDDALAVARELAAARSEIRVIDLPANGGQHRAVLAGFAQSQADWLISLDADLQDRPEDIPRLLERAQAGHPVVAACRANDYQSAGRMRTSFVFKRFHSWLTGYPRRAGMFFLVARPVAAAILERAGPRPFLPALLGLSGHPIAEVEVERDVRSAGQSAYSPGMRLSVGLHALAFAAGLRLRQASGALLAFAALTLLLAVGVALAFGPVDSWASLPLVYGGDADFNMFVIKTVTETGWYGENPRLGAPFGANLLDFAKPEGLHLFTLRLIGACTNNLVLTHNLFFLFGFFAVGATALWVFRTAIGLSWPLAVAGAFLYSWMPYHFFRIGHLLLSCYYAVPVGIWLILKASREALEPKDPRTWLACAVAASTGAYYAIFTGTLLLAAALIAALRERSPRRLVAACVPLALLALFLGINLLPSIRHQLVQGRNPEVASRSLGELDRFALSPALLVLPSRMHQSDVLAEPARAYEAAMVQTSEHAGSPIGILATLGFLHLLVLLLRGERDGDPGLLHDLARINAVTLGLAVTGGGGTLIAILVNPQIRAMNRLSIYLAFFGLAATLLLIQTALSRGGRRTALVACALIVFGWWDQSVMDRETPPPRVAELLTSDRDYVRAIERAVAPGAAIYQLPYVEFPEGRVRDPRLTYDHVVPFLHSERLRWSFGDMKGRPADLWHRGVSIRPVAEQVRLMAGAGFAGISVDRRLFADAGAALERELSQLGLHRAFESRLRDLAFYPLTPTGHTPELIPLPVVYGKGFYGREGSEADSWAWSAGSGVLLLYSQAREPRAAQLEMEIGAHGERTVEIAVAGTRRSMRLAHGQAERVLIPLQLPPGRTAVTLTTPELPVTAGGEDRRRIALQVKRPTITYR